MRLPRRRFLAGSLAAATITCPVGIVRGNAPAFASDPFTLGVASGSPREDSVVLWTRLAPRPLEGGGMPDSPVAVDWQIAEDEKFARLAAQGTVQAVAGAGPCRPCRGQGPAARPALLVSLPRRQCA